MESDTECSVSFPQRELRVVYSQLPFHLVGSKAVPSLYGRPSGIQPHPADEGVAPLRGNFIYSDFKRSIRLKQREWVKETKRLLGGDDAYWTYVRTFPAFFARLPHDIFFEVLSHLHPIDLYALIQTNRNFRQLLLHRSATTIWAAIFERHVDEFPRCPPQVSLPKWLSLMLGPPDCDKCGRPCAMYDFGLAKRLCSGCLRGPLRNSDQLNGLFITSRILEFNLTDNDFFALLRPVKRDVGASYYLNDPGNYLMSEVVTLAKSIRSFVIQDTPKAQDDFHVFRSKKLEEVRLWVESTNHYEQWAFKIHDRLATEESEHRDAKLVPGFQSRFRKMGCHPEDVDEIQYALRDVLCETNRFTTVTSRNCRRILRRLAAALKLAERGRLRRMLQAVKKKRIAALKEYYANYRRDVEPAHWDDLPEPEHIFSIHKVQQFLNHNPMEEVTVDPSLKFDIDDLCMEWVEKARAELLSTMKEYLPPDLYGSHKDPLELVSAVFGCPSQCGRFSGEHFVIGWEEIRLHLNCRFSKPSDQGFAPSQPRPFQCSLYTVTAVQLVVELLGLQVAGTTVQDVEHKAQGRRFACLTCFEHEDNQTNTRGIALTWREMIGHTIKCAIKHGSTKIALLSESLTQSILFHEVAFPPPRMPTWACTRCPHHAQEPARRAEVLTHLAEEHQITNPVADQDYVFLNIKPWIRQRVRFPADSKRCSLCPSPANRRLRTSKEVRRHLVDKHSVAIDLENVPDSPESDKPLFETLELWEATVSRSLLHLETISELENSLSEWYRPDSPTDDES